MAVECSSFMGQFGSPHIVSQYDIEVRYQAISDNYMVRIGAQRVELSNMAFGNMVNKLNLKSYEDLINKQNEILFYLGATKEDLIGRFVRVINPGKCYTTHTDHIKLGCHKDKYTRRAAEQGSHGIIIQVNKEHNSYAINCCGKHYLIDRSGVELLSGDGVQLSPPKVEIQPNPKQTFQDLWKK